MVACLRIQSTKTCTWHQKRKRTKKPTHIATNDGLSAKQIKKPMHIASQTHKTLNKHTNSMDLWPVCKTDQKTMHIASKAQKKTRKRKPTQIATTSMKQTKTHANNITNTNEKTKTTHK